MYAQNFKYPIQRLSYKEKVKDDYKWAKEVIRNLSSAHVREDGIQGTETSARREYNNILTNYQLYNNIINQKDFEDECNALGIDIGQNKDSIQPYNKIPTKIDIQLGEEYKRRFNFKVIAINEEGIKSKLASQTEQARSIVNKMFNDLTATIKQRRMDESQNLSPQEAQQLDQEIKQQVESLVDPQELKKLNMGNFTDYKEKAGNKILNYQFYAEEIKAKMNDGFKHGLIGGGEFIWVEADDYVGAKYQVLNRLGVIYHKSPDVKFSEDGLYGGYQSMMSIGDVLDLYGDYMKKEDIENLLSNYTSSDSHQNEFDKQGNIKYSEETTRFQNNILKDNHIGNYGASDSTVDVLVEKFEWRSEMKIYYVTLKDEYGEEIDSFIANENFIIPKEATKRTIKKGLGKKVIRYEWDEGYAEEGWIDEIWQGVYIDSRYMCQIGPRPEQHRSESNPRKLKLSLHGAIYNNTNAKGISAVDRMKPFQYLYFIVAHKLKKLIAQDQGQVFSFDTSMVSEKIGLEKTLYYLKEMNLDIFNSLENAEQPGASQRGKMKGSINMSNMQHIMNYVGLLDALDRQISDVAGISKGREGQTSAAQAVTTAQQDIVQSATITEAVYFAIHYKIWERAMNFGLQCTVDKIKAGKADFVRQYTLDDLTLASIQVTPEDVQEIEYGVFVSNFTRDNEVFETLKQLAHSFIQNDKASMADIIKIIKANSTQELEEQIRISEQERMEQQSQQSQQQSKFQEEQLRVQLDENEKERDLKRELAMLAAETTLKGKEIDSFKFQDEQDSNSNSIPDQLEIEKLKHQVKLDKDKLSFEKDKLKTQERIEKAKIKNSHTSTPAKK